MRIRLGTIVALLAAVSCAEANPEQDPRCVQRDASSESTASINEQPAAPASEEPVTAVGGLCDGSSEPKLLLTTGEGPGSVPQFRFGYDFGFPFLVIDGRCHYYALHDPMQGIMTGDLNAALLEQLTRELALTDLADLPSSHDECVDHWHDSLIATGDQSLRCTCATCSTERATAAMELGFEWIERLAAHGEPISGKLLALAIPREPMKNRPPWRVQTVFSWPLAEPMHGIPSLISPDWRGRGATFDGEAAAALRDVRERSSRIPLIDDLFASSSYVSDCGVSYQLELRDLLPDETAVRLTEFLAAAWTRPKIASCRHWNSSQPSSDCSWVD